MHGTSKDSRYARKIEIDCRKKPNQSEDFIMLTVNKPRAISVFIVGKTLFLSIFEDLTGTRGVWDVICCIIVMFRHVY